MVINNNFFVIRKNNCIIFPTSKLAIEVLKTLKNSGYIKEFEYIDDNKGGKFLIHLLDFHYLTYALA